VQFGSQRTFCVCAVKNIRIPAHLSYFGQRTPFVDVSLALDLLSRDGTRGFLEIYADLSPSHLSF